MQQIVYSTEETINGPWLINEEALSQLDVLVEKEYQRLRKRKEAVIEKEVNEDFNDLYMEYELNLGPGRTYVTDSLTQAMRDPAILGETPLALRLDLECGEVHAEFMVDGYDGNLDINVGPQGNAEAQELYSALRQWAMKWQAPFWQRVWHKHFGLQWGIWIVAILIAIFSILVISPSPREEARSKVKILLENGISEEEIYKAIELLLILESNVSESQLGTIAPSWLKALFWGGLILCIILSVKPKIVIGIGKGIERLKFWKWWLRSVSVTLPSVLLGTFLWPFLYEAFLKFIK